MSRAFNELKKLCRAQGIAPGMIERWTPRQVVDTRAPSKKKAYAEAFVKLHEQGMGAQAHHVKAFVKDEKGPDNDKACRLIQYRDGMEFTADLATFLAPLEHRLYQLTIHGTRCFAKQLNPKQRAQAIFAAYRGLKYKYRMLDHSAFDSHVSLKHLRYEHKFYLWLFRNDPELSALLGKQLRNRVRSGCGVSWVTKGGRMSGDFNTALGNSVINILVLLAWAMKTGVYKDANFQVCVDGDDSWMLYRADCPDPTPADFLDFGMTTKIEDVGIEPESVGFCQAKPVMLSDGPMMCRDYRRVLARVPYSIQRYSGVAWGKYAKGVALCERALGQGVPVLDALSESLLSSFRHVSKTLIPKSEEWSYGIAQSVANDDRKITDASRVSYALAWGISPGEQVQLEQLLRQHSWEMPGTVRDGA